jgi:methenyltetrahydromethanopterin cyclohydrolase
MNSDAFFLNNEPAAVHVSRNGKQIIDIGLENRCAWASAKSLVEGLIHSQGTVNFGEMKIGQYQLPTLDLFLDEPSKLAKPATRTVEGGEIHVFPDEHIEVGLFPSLPREIDIGEAFLAVTKDTGLVASVFRSYIKTAETIAECRTFGLKPEEILWGWSTMLLAPLCDSLSLTLDRQNTVAAHGGIVSLWVRMDRDDDIKALIKKLSPRGEIRLQNLKTGNTFIFGSVNSAACEKTFGLASAGADG